MKQRARTVLALAISGALTQAHAAAPITTGARALAASSTAHSNRVCLAARPFYWEVGDQQSVLASGSEGPNAPGAATMLPLSTASEWIFAAYVVQARGGKPNVNDVRALTMRSGYTNLQSARCVQRTPGSPHSLTVAQCFHAAHLVGGGNSDFHSKQVDRFYFNGGHFQQLAASDPTLSALTAATLTGTIGNELGMDGSFDYASPELDAGIHTTTTAYGAFLRRILGNQLLIHDQLGADPTCTNPARCSQAINTPLPQTENSHYSLGHWVEDDPRVGDGAFSDPGLQGFYPWIDASRTYYGVIGRTSTTPGAYVVSMQCGRLIRRAWLAGRAP